MSEISDSQFVANEYGDERKFAERLRAHAEYLDGPDARAVVLDEIARAGPRHVLDVGCGPGELGTRIVARTGADVVAVDVSERMVELARAAGLDARLADVCALPFDNECFDVCVAAWMLYHVSDVPSAVAELARVLQHGGRLVAATGTTIPRGPQLMDIFGDEQPRPPRRLSFSAENGDELLRAAFSEVKRVNVEAAVVYPDREAIRRRLLASMAQAHRADEVPEIIEPYRVSIFDAVFVATR